jgi:hypothetical protein
MEDLERVPNPASSVDGTTVGIDVEAAVREGTLTAEQGLGVLHIYTLGVILVHRLLIDSTIAQSNARRAFIRGSVLTWAYRSPKAWFVVVEGVAVWGHRQAFPI